MRKRLALTAGVAAIVLAYIPAKEAIKLYVYRDPVGIATYCAGETEDPEWGKKYTMAECMIKLNSRLEEFNAGVASCTTAPMSDRRRAAMISFAYNVGVRAYCASTLVKKLNAGDPHACDELLKWTRARGVELRGLVRRRQEERALCLR